MLHIRVVLMREFRKTGVRQIARIEGGSSWYNQRMTHFSTDIPKYIQIVHLIHFLLDRHRFLRTQHLYHLHCILHRRLFHFLHIQN